MKTLIIYDSYFGNTQKVAEQIAKTFSKDTTVLNVKDFKEENLKDIDMLIVGSPTRAFSPSENIKPFLKSLPSLKGIKIGVFDTRLDVKKIDNKILTFLVKLFGYASEKIQKTLLKKEGIYTLEPLNVYVEESEGPLCNGEIEKIDKWTKGI